MTEPTLCEDCEHVESQSRKGHPGSWLCMKFPRLEGHGYVSRSYWANKEPWMKCWGINGGLCCLYSPRRNLKKEPEDGQCE